MKRYLFALALLSGVLLALPISKANAEDVVVGEYEDEFDTATSEITLAWDRNREEDIAGYNVYYGRASGDYERIETVVPPTATITVRGKNTVYFAVTAFNTSGVESELSEEVHYP